MKDCYGFVLNDDDIMWVRKEDVKGVKLYELSLCFDEQVRGYNLSK